MKCTEDGCDGLVKIEENTGVELRINCLATETAYPCQKCGRLYWPDESGGFTGGVFSRRGEKAFLIAGQLINRPADESI